MATNEEIEKQLAGREYEAGFVTDIESDTLPPGLSEETIRFISAKKDEPKWLLDWRLQAYAHWLTMEEPTWAAVDYKPTDYQSISYFSAPKSDKDAPKSLDEVDPKLLETYEKLGIPLREHALLAGVVGSNVAVDAVFDSVSVATTFRDKLSKVGVIFCPISEAVRDYPELVQQYLGSVVPQ
ncbi:MAG: Fe-S cluster assembly protein SufB, partial [Ghiorsea sp.]